MLLPTCLISTLRLFYYLWLIHNSSKGKQKDLNVDDRVKLVTLFYEKCNLIMILSALEPNHCETIAFS